MLITTAGLVVSERDTGENDRYISVLTEEYGIIDISAKGAKKITGKNNAPTQLFAYSKFCINERNGRFYLNSSEPVHIFYGLRLDVQKLSLACYIAEVASYSVVAEKTSHDVMRLILNSLYMLENDKRTCEFVKCVFELRFVSDIGHLPQLIGCRDCFKHEDDEMFFMIDKANLLCGEHFHDGGYLQNYYNVNVSKSLLHAMRYICLIETEKVFNFKISDATQKSLSEITEKYLLTHLQRSFKSLNYYKSLHMF